jgi:hypothetical protein
VTREGHSFRRARRLMDAYVGEFFVVEPFGSVLSFFVVIATLLIALATLVLALTT